MRVRPARRDDAAAMAEVHVQTWQAAYEHIFGAERLAAVDLAERRARWEERLAAADPHWRSWVAEGNDGRVVGFATAGASRDGDAEGELYAIYVLPEAWGGGAGPALMRAATEDLRKHGFRSAFLWVLEDNPRARHFYEREGWTLDGGRREHEALGVTFAEVRYRLTFS
jgi:ribosomal protein S18 acetylase RimI-like enzyme